MSIQFVYFDLGNILVSFDPEIACRNVATRFGVSVDQARGAVYESGLEDQFELGNLSGDEFADQVRGHLQLTESAAPTPALLDAVSDMFTPVESMAELVRRARQKVGRIGLLSNTCSAHWDWVCRQRWAVSTLEFDVLIRSYEVGAMKPDARIYEAAEKAAGVSAEELLFIDDKQENVDAARRRGWNAEQCFGGPEAETSLARWLEQA